MKMRLPNGLAVHAANRIDARFLYNEIFVQECYLKHGVELREGATIFDVGANIGMFDLFVAQELRDFTLFAFEPIPDTFDLLRQNTSRLADKVRLFNMGLSDHAGEATFTHYPRATALATCSPGHLSQLRAARNDFVAGRDRLHPGDPARSLRSWPRSTLARILDLYFFAGERTVRCRLETVSNVIEESAVRSIDLLKIDVENSEWEVLAGVDRADWARINQVVLEVHDIDDRLRRVLALLEDHDFDVVADQDDWGAGFGVFNVYARKPEAA
jgi:FkbM family methyltransferase